VFHNYLVEGREFGDGKGASGSLEEFIIWKLDKMVQLICCILVWKGGICSVCLYIYIYRKDTSATVAINIIEARMRNVWGWACFETIRGP
jgi:hypothetical protein